MSSYESKTTATEGCQITMAISSNTTTNASLGQEVICNSLAWALIAKQVLPNPDTSYQDYKEKASLTKITPDGKTFFPLYVAPETFYNSIPVMDSLVITSNR